MMNNDKHAYLIIAYNEPKLLAVLLSMLDDERNDIFIHIDKKSKVLDSFTPKLRYAQLHILKNRIDVRWGSFSLVACELLLMKAARSRGCYRYYHLLSGVDLPIKSQDYIHAFFNDTNKNFISYSHGDYAKKDVFRKMHDYNILYSYRKSPFLIRNAIKVVRIIFNLLFSNIFKRPFDMEYKKGVQWFSVTEPVIEYILDNEDFIKTRFKYTFCADEIFIQSLVWNNPQLRETVYSFDDEYEGCKRLIDWKRGGPYVWTYGDKDEIQASDKLFARKFSSQHMDVVNWIKNTFSKSEK